MTQTPSPLPAAYILPIRRDAPMAQTELQAMTDYLQELSSHVEVIVVDSSPDWVFQHHERAWGDFIHHVRTAPDLQTPMGKVGNVLTGVRYASHERLIIADDDVRYTPTTLVRVIQLLDQAEVVRPQNYFDPLPWHARWDSARTLLNRMTGGDWPGTLAVRRSALLATGGYDGSVLFENLELVRTVRAAGGREVVAQNLFVRREPPTARHFWSQRTRQAYDELARPLRLAIWLAVLPTALALGITRRWIGIMGLASGIVALAEAGRRREGATEYFPITASLLAPLWVFERGVCSWLALGSRLLLGGVRYRGGRLRRAATPMSELRRRHRGALTPSADDATPTTTGGVSGRSMAHV